MAAKKIKNVKLTEKELQAFSKEELVRRFLMLQEHNVQLKNLLTKLQTVGDHQATPVNHKETDLTKCGSQHVFVRLLYLGWEYRGYAAVEDSVLTVEHCLFSALLKCRLIRSRDTCSYHRCGRTDKGVSAFSQVISLSVRCGSDGEPLDYCGMLNRLLPRDIRVTGWCPMAPDASARFNCNRRFYRYYFPCAQLDIQGMREAAEQLKGTHDFRNLCKMDVGNGVTNFVREIFDVSIQPLPDQSEWGGYGLYELRIYGRGFLWHQVRCIVAVLLHVGQRLESPSIVANLLDLDLCPRKPQYQMAGETGLCLFSTEFDLKTPWIMERSQLVSVVTQLQHLWTISATKTAQIREMLRGLEAELGEGLCRQADVLLGSNPSQKYKPLLQRNTCCSLEERVEHYSKRFKMSSVPSDSCQDISNNSNAPSGQCSQPYEESAVGRVLTHNCPETT